MTTIDRLAAQILGWANDRNLIEGSTVKKQYVKLVEEHGEFAAGLARGKEDVMVDALGDKMVILIIMAAQGKVNLPYSLSFLCGSNDYRSYDSSVEAIRGNLAGNLAGVEFGFIQSSSNIGFLGETLLSDAYTLVRFSEDIGQCFGDCLAQCFEAALDPVKVLEDVWNIIKDRKGRMVDGVFIKENDAMMGGAGNQQ